MVSMEKKAKTQKLDNLSKKYIKQKNQSQLSQSIDSLIQVVSRLRDPENGCAWDRAQTHSSLIPYVLEEAYEVADAIRNGNNQNLKEELGDLLLQVILHAQIASETNHQSSISSPSSSLNLSFSSPTKECTFIFDTNFDRTESPAIFDVDFDAAVKAASDFDQYFEFQSNMNEPSSSDPSMFTSVLSDLNEKLDVSILGASGRSSPAHSLDTSHNNSLIDLDF